MNPDQIKDVVESIKTLNINFNDATTQKIADAIIPLVKSFLMVRLIEDIIVFVGVIGGISIAATVIYKLASKQIEANKNKPENEHFI